jgi:hypothetical protein
MPLFIHDIIKFIKGTKKASVQPVLCNECGKVIAEDEDKYHRTDNKELIKYYCSEKCKTKNPVIYKK